MVTVLKRKNQTRKILVIVGIALAISLSLFALSPRPLQIATLHSDGFENGLTGYTIYETGGEVCSTELLANNYVAKFTTNANASDEQAYINRYLGTTYESLTVGKKFRIDTPLTMANDHIDVFGLGGGAGSLGKVAITLTPTGMQWSLKSIIFGETDFSGTVSANTWYTIKLVGEYARTDGEVALYVDGAKILSQQGDLSSVAGVYNVRVGILYHWQMSPSLTVYVDDFVIQTGEEETTQQTLTIQSNTGGSTTPSAGQHTYEYGTQVSITATADANYVFDNWLLDGSDVGSSNPYLLTMNANHTIQPVFTPSPPPGQATLKVHAFAGENEVNAVFYIDGSGPYETTLNGTTVTLTAPGTYEITATWEGQTRTHSISLVSEEVKRLDMQFSSPQTEILWILLLVSVASIGTVVGAALYIRYYRKPTR